MKNEIVITQEQADIQNAIIERLRKRLENKKLTYYITTFGCQMNVRDSEKLKGILEKIGYTPAQEEKNADFVIYNTCCVRENAELKVYGRIGFLKAVKRKNPNLMIAICGCMMQQESVVGKIKKSYRHVDIVFGTHNLYKLAELIESRMDSERTIFDIWTQHKEIVEDLPSIRSNPYKASVNITYGCNNYCSYCIVPYVRGRERSRKSQDILDEIRALANEGVKEIMLLGQNVNSYGIGLEERIGFAELLQKIEEVEGIERIRFMTSHPKDLSDQLIATISKSKKICNHLHLPFQSGSTQVLKAMNRKYTKEQYIELADKIKKQCPQIALSTDIIVGFPGETEEDFLDTMDIVNHVKYDFAYTFIYSKRTGTPAATMENQIDEKTSKERFNRLLELVNRISYEKSKEHIGKTCKVLVEEVNAQNGDLVSGRLSNNHLIHFKGSSDLIGKIIEVRITGAKSFYLTGEVV